MIYALKERIGDPNLFCGRNSEMELLLNWTKRIPKELGKSKALLGRRKSGKTAMMERLFNILWNQKGQVVPFYFEIQDQNKWLLHFSDDYLRTFLSQYLSFLLRIPLAPNNEPWTWNFLEDSAREIKNGTILQRIDTFRNYYEAENEHQAMKLAFGSPSFFAGYEKRSFLVMIDEIQYMTEYIYQDKAHTVQASNLPGAFHSLVELKTAPMMVSGSYIGWMTRMIEQMFVGGRLKRTPISPRLTFEGGMEAVYQYASHHGTDITEDVAFALNTVTQSNPYYISCIFGSEWSGRDFSSIDGVISTFANEITDRNSELYRTWEEYIRLSLKKVNDAYGKQILLILSRERDRELGRDEILEKLEWNPEDEPKLEEKLLDLEYGDLVTRGSTDYHYRGIPDDVLYLIFHDRYLYEIYRRRINVKEELAKKVEDLEKDKKSLQGKLNELKGRMLELVVWRELNACRKKREPIKDFQKRIKFPDSMKPVTQFFETALFDLVWMNYTVNLPGVIIQELDVLAAGQDDTGSWALVFETKNRNEEKLPSLEEAKQFKTKIQLLEQTMSKPVRFVCPVYFSAGGFSEEVETWLHGQGICTTDLQTWEKPV